MLSNVHTLNFSTTYPMRPTATYWLRSASLAVLLAFSGSAVAQDTYQTPPPALANLVNNPGTPVVSFTRDGKSMILMHRSESPSIEDLAQEELRLGGVRFNPANHSPSRSGYTTGMTIKDIATGAEKPVTGLPSNAKITSMTWTTDGNMMAFMNMTDTGNEVWIFDLKAASVRKLTDAVVSNVYGPGIGWMPDDKTLMVSLIANKGPRPAKPRAPSGPIVQENSGDVNAVRTFQDMLQNPYDEQLLEHFFTTQPAFVTMDGKITPFAEPAIYANINVSPDGKYMLSTVVNKPYSYLVPVSGFERTVNIHDGNGKLLRKFADLPSSEKTPTGRGATSAGKRSINWRSDAPATLVWVEALDGGDPRATVSHRDEVFTLDAPFTAQPKSFAKLEHRYGGIMWGRADLAMMSESWAESRLSRSWIVNPANPSERRVFIERSTQDAYNNPGSPRMTRNQYGNMVLLFTPDGKGIYMSGQGASPQGNRPFLDVMDLTTTETKRLWQSQPPFYETMSQMVDDKPEKLIISRESNDLQPNYYIVDVASGNLTQITDFPHPNPEFTNVSKEFIKYKRSDGIDMTGTLYLPEGYDKEKDGPLPMLMWAYPREFRSADEAGQVTGSPYTFTRVSANSALPYVLAGYAVLDNASMPIVGTDEVEPNDVFIEQLVLNAEAAVNEMVNMGVADRERIAVGGHSYGAFMTAHLLAHTDLFRAGIARSGAYNRSLTPFGFQSEPRTYWDDTDLYVKMSPFTYANKINEPILMIHGTADNNSGTFPIQSERMYAALKGHGATARLVMLPEESHGYTAKESVLHMMWETVSWLDKYVKNAPPREELRRIPTTESGGER